MKIIFAGTPEFAAAALQGLLEAGHDLVCVLTQPDRPAGRGMRMHVSPVKELAIQHDLQVLQPVTLRDAEVQQSLRNVQADIMVVAAYGLILPQVVLDIPRRGAVNIHASLLPRWRGAAPIQRAILAGDTQTGVCIMQMDAGLDTGPVLLLQATPINFTDTAQTVHDRLAALGARLVVEALVGLEKSGLLPVPQPDEGATYAKKIEKAEARIDWTRTAPELDRHIRAFDPFPGASGSISGHDVKVWRAMIGVHGDKDNGRHLADAQPGTVLDSGSQGILVACGSGTLRLLELQRAGGKRLAADRFLQGLAIEPGMRFANS